MTIYKFAGFWRRLTAYLIDSTVIAIIFMILSVVACVAFIAGTKSAQSMAWLTELTDSGGMSAIGMIFLAVYTVFFLAYFTYFHGLNGRTPGKRLLGLQVVTVDGSSISFGIAFLRSVGYLVSSLLFTLPLGFIWAAFDKKKQGWHDKIAGTAVIIREPDGDAAGLSILDAPDGAPQQPSSAVEAGIVLPEREQAIPALSVGESAAPNDQKIP